MNCPSCGKANVEGISFCEYCGVALRSVAAPGVAASAPKPTAADVANMGKSLLKTLSLGEKFTAGGVLAAVLGFFMPFISTPDLGPLEGLLSNLNPGAAEAAHTSVSLLDLSKLMGAFYFILLAAIAAGVLFYISRSAAHGRKLLISGFQVMIGSLFGPTYLLALLFVPLIQSVAGWGYWLVALGFCAITAGGLISIGQLARNAR